MWQAVLHLTRFSRPALSIPSGNCSVSQPNAPPSYTTICLRIFIFRGEPDVYYRRHVLCYFTSPTNRNFHETVRVQRENDQCPWKVDPVHDEMDWTLSVRYIGHVNAGCFMMPQGEEMMLVDIVSKTPVTDKEYNSDWNCLNFVLEGLGQIVSNGLQTQEWYDRVEKELIDKLVDGSVP